jgi:hypothetical protein
MENKFILKQILLPTILFGIAVFSIEELMLHARETVWTIVLVPVLSPVAIVCRMVGIHDLGAAGALNQWSTYTLAGNALLYCLLFALVAWVIATCRKQ